MKLTGLTGGIGTGKSTVARILRLRGYEVYDCDLEAKRLMDESMEVRRSLRDRWGEEIYSTRGELDRRKVAEYVFADRREKAWLDSLVHGLVRDDVKRWAATHTDYSHDTVFVESAILFTSGLADMCQEVWEVTAPLDTRVERVMKRSGLTREQALARIDAQREEQKICRSRHTRQIVNDATTPLLDAIPDIN
jgi:dephospho-coA kinase